MDRKKRVKDEEEEEERRMIENATKTAAVIAVEIL